MPSTSKATNKVDYQEWVRFNFMLEGLRLETGLSSKDLSRRLFGSKGYITHAKSHRSIVGTGDVKKVEKMARKYGVPLNPPLLDDGRMPEGREEIIQAMQEVEPLYPDHVAVSWPDFLPDVKGRSENIKASPKESDLFYALVKNLIKRGISKTDIAVEYCGYSSIASLSYTLNTPTSTPTLKPYRNLVIKFATRHGTTALKDIALRGGNGLTATKELVEQVMEPPRSNNTEYARSLSTDSFDKVTADLKSITARLEALGRPLPKGMQAWLKDNVVDPIGLATLHLEDK